MQVIWPSSHFGSKSVHIGVTFDCAFLPGGIFPISPRMASKSLLLAVQVWFGCCPTWRCLSVRRSCSQDVPSLH